mmetsp:Transcript_9496/g.21788  ORF Transcript_9496/g.21788 Transcript_9496/m.21788 type:complete len:271 (+) Transcript_9496:331-1143(+)
MLLSRKVKRATVAGGQRLLGHDEIETIEITEVIATTGTSPIGMTGTSQGTGMTGRGAGRTVESHRGVGMMTVVEAEAVPPEGMLTGTATLSHDVIGIGIGTTGTAVTGIAIVTGLLVTDMVIETGIESETAVGAMKAARRGVGMTVVADGQRIAEHLAAGEAAGHEAHHHVGTEAVQDKVPGAVTHRTPIGLQGHTAGKMTIPVAVESGLVVCQAQSRRVRLTASSRDMVRWRRSSSVILILTPLALCSLETPAMQLPPSRILTRLSDLV